MLTLEQLATNSVTSDHIRKVQSFLHIMIKELCDRADRHDLSKLESPEVEAFTEATPRLAGITYGSEEYKAELKAIKPAIDHHNANNRHHPEHFASGVADMNLVDLVEMFCDWKASSMRHNDGNLRRSIEINGNRFGLPPMLIAILDNSIELVE